MFSVTDWALKRVLKFILKRNLGQYLKNEVDLEQLDVQLGRGILELRNVLLNCDTINQQLVGKGWVIKAGYCGCLRANIPLSGFGSSKCAVELDEVMLTIVPDTTPGTKAQQSEPDPTPAEPFISFEDIGLGQLGVVEGIRRIAGGIQTILQHLAVSAKDITIRIELPVAHASSASTVITLRCELIEYSDKTADGVKSSPGTTAPSTPPPSDLIKQVEVRGLLVELGGYTGTVPCSPPLPLGFSHGNKQAGPSAAPDVPVTVLSGTGGQGITVCLQLHMLKPPAPAMPPKLQSDVSLGPTKVLLLPTQLPLLARITSYLQSHSSSGSAPPHPAFSSTTTDLGDSIMYGSSADMGAGGYTDGSTYQSWGGRSFVEDLFFPDCQGLVASTLGSSHMDLLGSVQPGQPSGSLHDEFYEARSMFSSATTSMLASTSSALGYMYSTVSSTLGSMAAGTGAAEAATATTWSNTGLHDRGPAATQPPAPPAPPRPPQSWSVNLSAADLCIMLCYPQPLGAAAAAASPGRLEPPLDPAQRLTLQCCDLSVSCSMEGRQCTLAAKVQELEAAEYLPPGTGAGAGGPAAASATEFAAVPGMLPAGASGSSRPMPHHLRAPPQHHGGAGARGPRGPAHRLEPLEVWPVLCCGGGRRSGGEAAKPCMSTTLRTEPGGRPGITTSLEAELDLQPVTLWVTMGVLQRLSGLAELVGGPGKAAEPGPGAAEGSRLMPRATSGGAPRELQHKIASIMDDLRQCTPQHGGAAQRSALSTLEVSAAICAPHVCLVLMLPAGLPAAAAAAGDVPPPAVHGQRYMALDLTALQDSATPSARHRNARTAARHLPVVKLQKITKTTGVVAHEEGTVDVSFASVKVHLLGAPQLPSSHGQRHPQLTTACVLELKPAESSGPRPPVGPDDVPQGAAVFAQLKWDPSARVAAGAVDNAWTQAAAHAKDRWAEPEGDWERHSAFNSLRFKEGTVKTSTLFAHVRAPRVLADFSRADLLAIWQLACSWLYAGAQPQYAASSTPPTQVALLLSCRVQCSLHSASNAVSAAGAAAAAADPHRALRPSAQPVTAFTAAVDELTLFQVSNLGGTLGASAVSLEVQGLEVVGGSSHSCLLHSPSVGPQGSSGAQVCVDVLHVSRPDPGPRLEVVRSLSSLALRGVTVLADYGRPGFNWGLELSNFFQLPMPDLPTVAPCQQVAEVVVNLEDVALRYEPLQEPRAAAAAAAAAPPAPPVAAVLMLEGLHWHLRPDEAQKEVVLHNISFHVAACHRRGAGWHHNNAKAVRPATLQASGYHCVAQEGAVHVLLRPAVLCSHDPQHSVQELELSNQHLCGSLTQESAVLLAQLAGQCAAAMAPAPQPAAQPPGPAAAAAAGRPAAGNGRGTAAAPSGAAAPVAIPMPTAASAGVVPMAASPGTVRVLEGLREDAFRVGSHGAASVFVEGHWYEPPEASEGDALGRTSSIEEEMSERGSGPTVVEDYFLMVTGCDGETTMEDGEPEEMDCDDGTWYGEPAAAVPPAAAAAAVQPPAAGGAGGGSDGGGTSVHLQEDYMQRPAGEEEGLLAAYCPLPLRGRATADAGPCPVSRVLLNNLSLLLVLHAKSPSGRAGAPHEGRVEVELEGLSVLVEDFGALGHVANRLTVNLHMLEVRDCSVRGESNNRWSRVLSLRSVAGQQRDGRVPMAHVTLEAVRPAPQEQPSLQEFRLLVAVLPLRLRLDQDVVLFLAAFGQAVGAAMPQQPEPQAENPDGGVYFQRCEVRAFSVLVDYRPRRVDLAALRDGSLLELLNLVPWGGIDINLKALKLAGLTGGDGLAAALAREWLDDIARTQAYKFVVGIAPINSICRASSAVAMLLRPPNSGSRGALRALPDSRLRRQLQRSTTSFVRTLMHEALGLGATVAAGAQLVLQGSTGMQYGEPPPAGVMEGLRQAADRLHSGFEAAAREMVMKPAATIRNGEGVRAAVVQALRAAPGAAVGPASAAAAAVRCTLLGVRNALDPDRGRFEPQ